MSQIHRVPNSFDPSSPHPTISSPPSGVIAKAFTLHLERITPADSPVGTSHRRIRWGPPAPLVSSPTASVRPSGENATHSTNDPWPLDSPPGTCRAVPV